MFNAYTIICPVLPNDAEGPFISRSLDACFE